MCALFQASKIVPSENEAAPPPPYIPMDEFNAAVNEWGVWPADAIEIAANDSLYTSTASAAEIESRVRCGNEPVNRQCTAPSPDSKCVFKWAFATTAAATACQCSCCLLGLEECEMVSSFCDLACVPLAPCQSSCQFQSGPVHSTVPGTVPMIMETMEKTTSSQRPRLNPPCSILSTSTSKDSSYSHHYTHHHHQQYQYPSQPSLLTSEHSSYSPLYSPFSSTSSQPSNSPQPYTYEEQQQIPFIDSLIAEVRSEMIASEAQLAPPSPSMSSDITSISRKSSASTSSSAFRDVVVSPGQTLVIRGDDGQEYKLIVERIENDSAIAKPLKRKISGDSVIAPKRARAPPVSLVNLSDEEIAERKKQQNRAAALRYRQKLRENRVVSVSTKETLTQRNAFLRDEATRLTSECDVLRRMIFDRLGKNAPAFS